MDASASRLTVFMDDSASFATMIVSFQDCNAGPLSVEVIFMMLCIPDITRTNNPTFVLRE